MSCCERASTARGLMRIHCCVLVLVLVRERVEVQLWAESPQRWHKSHVDYRL